MMMANSRADGPGLDEKTIAELAAALDAFIRDQKAERLQLLLQRIAVEAREKGMHAEQMLVSLKDVWYSLPSVKNETSSVEQNRMLQRVVSLCIREYYGGD